MKPHLTNLKPVLLLFFAISFVLIILPMALIMLFASGNPGDIDKNGNHESGDKTAITKKVKLPKTLKVFCDSAGKTVKLDLEEYVKGVVASEMPSDFPEEALKAQAVAARTYSVARILRYAKSNNPQTHPSAPLCDTTHCQVYQSEAQLKKVKGSKWMKNDWGKLCSAVNDTKGQIMYYDGEIVEQALFHSSSGGRTESCKDVFAASVPYLVSVDSPYEKDATHKSEKTTLTFTELRKKISSFFPNAATGPLNKSNIKILKRSSGNHVHSIQIGDAVLAGSDVRRALDLYSSNFTLKITGNRITFETTGSGHGVGMSQYGAKGMAEAGYDYKKILQHYYSGIEIK